MALPYRGHIVRTTKLGYLIFQRGGTYLLPLFTSCLEGLFPETGLPA
jgi:hypothetical protein